MLLIFGNKALHDATSGVFINQGKYARVNEGIQDGRSKTNATPMSTLTKLDKDASSKSVDVKLYKGRIDSLLYLTAS